MENRDGHNKDTKFFIGVEVEHSPAYGQRTLFVVGPQNPKEVLARALNNDCPHIYLGANQSFEPNDEWNFVLTTLVKEGVWVTLDFDVQHTEWVLETGASEYINFIPMISVKLPYIEQFNYNATLKIDDKGFKASNPGIWCHSVHTLMDRKVFTDWSKYTQDKIIE